MKNSGIGLLSSRRWSRWLGMLSVPGPAFPRFGVGMEQPLSPAGPDRPLSRRSRFLSRPGLSKVSSSPRKISQGLMLQLLQCQGKEKLLAWSNKTKLGKQNPDHTAARTPGERGFGKKHQQAQGSFLLWTHLKDTAIILGIKQRIREYTIAVNHSKTGINSFSKKPFPVSHRIYYFLLISNLHFPSVSLKEGRLVSLFCCSSPSLFSPF